MEKTPSPEQFLAKEEVEKFITRVWEHPLLNEQTIEHRQKAKTLLPSILEQYGLTPDAYITIPVGSVLWTTDEKSDFDYTVIAKDYKTAGIIQLGYMEYKREKVQILDLERIPNILDGRMHRAANLFLTPDNYLGGSLDVVHELRKQVIEKIAHDKNPQKYWEQMMTEYFDGFMRDWDAERSNFDGWRREAHQTDDPRSRTNRAKQRIEERADMTHNPEAWKEAFARARANIQVPDFATFQKAILETDGAINLNEKWAADHIK